MTAHASSCPFCARIIAGDVDDTDLDDVVSFEPLRPVTPGHLLFVPLIHARDYRRGKGPLLLSRAMLAAGLHAAQTPLQGSNLIVSAGEVATQTVRHLHVHYVPRRLGDGLTLPWTGQA